MNDDFRKRVDKLESDIGAVDSPGAVIALPESVVSMWSNHSRADLEDSPVFTVTAEEEATDT